LIIGGVFDPGSWETERAILHHDDYHYRFYHYLSKSGGEAEAAFVREIAAALAGSTRSIPEAAKKAFKHWPGISKSLRDLFDRAPREAITDPEAVLASMVLAEIGKRDYPASAAAVVRERAERVLAECAERGKGLVEKVIEEPKRLVAETDDFVALFGRADHRFAVDEAERRVRQFLDDCRRLDRALSDIPRRLREGASGVLSDASNK